MSAITEARAALEELLTTAGVRASGTIPERITPPIAVIRSGSPYLEEATFGNTYKLRLGVTLITAQGTNAVETASLDEALETVVLALSETWGIESIGTPEMIQASTSTFYSITLTVTQEITLGGN